MSVLTEIDQRKAQPTVTDDHVETRGVVQSDQPQPSTQLNAVESPAATGVERTDAARISSDMAAMAATVGVALMAAVALFALGLSGRHIGLARRNLLEKVADIRIPLVIPAVTAEVVWQTFKSNRTAALAASDSGAKHKSPEGSTR